MLVPEDVCSPSGQHASKREVERVGVGSLVLGFRAPAGCKALRVWFDGKDQKARDHVRSVNEAQGSLVQGSLSWLAGVD